VRAAVGHQGRAALDAGGRRVRQPERDGPALRGPGSGRNKARGECERDLLDAFIRDAKEAHDWRAWAWLLERRFAESYSTNPRVLAAVQLGQLAQPLLAGENPWDHLPPQTIEQIAISHLRQLRELGAVPPEQAEVIEQLEQDYDFPAGRYPVRKGEAAESVEGISRQAVVREAQPAQEPTAAEPQAVELSEDELLELGRRLCAEGTHVGRRARMQTCIGCGLTQSRPLRLVEEFA
jgi:hypothetical protein